MAIRLLDKLNIASLHIRGEADSPFRIEASFSFLGASSGSQGRQASIAGRFDAVAAFRGAVPARANGARAALLSPAWLAMGRKVVSRLRRRLAPLTISLSDYWSITSTLLVTAPASRRPYHQRWPGEPLDYRNEASVV